MKNLLTKIREPLLDYMERTNHVPTEARTSVWFYRQIREAIGIYEDSQPPKAIPDAPGAQLMGIPLCINPDVPENEFHWVRDGQVIGKIVVSVTSHNGT